MDLSCCVAYAIDSQLQAFHHRVSSLHQHQCLASTLIGQNVSICMCVFHPCPIDLLANHWCWYELLATIWRAYSVWCKSKLAELLAGLRVLT